MLFQSPTRQLKLFAKKNTLHGTPNKISGRFAFKSTADGNTVVIEDGVVFSDLQIELIGEENVLHFGSNAKLSGKISIRNSSKITIGSRTQLEGACNLSASDGRTITIGTDCLLTATTVRTSDIRQIFDISSRSALNPPEDIRIGNHVLLSHSAHVSRGVYIGDGAVIASHSVVVGNVNKDCAVAGNPATLVRKNIRWK